MAAAVIETLTYVSQLAKRHHAVTKLLISRRARITSSKFDADPIEIAARQGHVKVLKLLSKGVDLLRERPRTGMPLAHVARGHVGVLEFL